MPLIQSRISNKIQRRRSIFEPPFLDKFHQFRTRKIALYIYIELTNSFPRKFNYDPITNSTIEYTTTQHSGQKAAR